MWLANGLKKYQNSSYSPAAHGDHPNQENQRHLVDPLSHYSHPLLANQARHLLQGGPKQNSTVMVVKYYCSVLEVTIMTSLTLLENDKVCFTAFVAADLYCICIYINIS